MGPRPRPTVDDKQVAVTGQAGKRRPVPLADPTRGAMLRDYLEDGGCTYGPLSRAETKRVGDPLRHASVQELWAKSRAVAHVNATIHPLRYARPCEMIIAGVSPATIPRRLGHANAQTPTPRCAHPRDTRPTRRPAHLAPTWVGVDQA